MKTKDIINAYTRIRTIDHTIPDDVLDFMKNAAIAALESNSVKEELTSVWLSSYEKHQSIKRLIGVNKNKSMASNIAAEALIIGNDAVVEIMDSLKKVIDKL